MLGILISIVWSRLICPIIICWNRRSVESSTHNLAHVGLLFSGASNFQVQNVQIMGKLTYIACHGCGIFQAPGMCSDPSNSLMVSVSSIIFG